MRFVRLADDKAHPVIVQQETCLTPNCLACRPAIGVIDAMARAAKNQRVFVDAFNRKSERAK